MRKEDLKADAVLIRQQYLKKPVGKGNVALAELQVKGGVAFCAAATSRGGSKSPIREIPKPKSAGGQFEPAIDSRTQRMMDTDAEYKVLSQIADTLEMFYDLEVEGQLYLYTEFQPCESCNSILRQFKEKFPHIKIEVFWDYPYPPES
ncbi:deaminase domain-containing protein [Microcoleus sp. T3_D1]|uniref:deaminase domain-containing protein n=1 Tax=Microcoleus sp. T3_D1 TaxID=3055427 RepID=UPI0040409327